MIELYFRRMMVVAIVLGLGTLSPTFARAKATNDEVLDWNAVLRTAVVSPLNTPQIPEPARFRIGAIVHTAMFDALNGIERRYSPIYVTETAPRGASRRAAVVQAAYTTLSALVPASIALYDQQLETSLDQIAADEAVENAESIARGRAWGHEVATAILAWRADDGFNPPAPPYLGSDTVGKWRPTPTGFAPGLLPSLARTAPFILPVTVGRSLDGPPALASAEYAADFAEVKSIGENTSATRTADQTEAARFFAGTAMTFWNRVADVAARRRHLTLSENARLFVHLNTAMADSIITTWAAKYDFEFWRPVTAIRLASTDGNSATQEQANWTPLVVTPPYPEYPAGHPSISGAAQAVLTSYFGDQMAVQGTSEALPGVVRHWPNFAAAADEANLARIWAGIHFRTAVTVGRSNGDDIGRFVVLFAARPKSNNDR
jgi:hypothetical protein